MQNDIVLVFFVRKLSKIKRIESKEISKKKIHVLCLYPTIENTLEGAEFHLMWKPLSV